MTLSRVILKIKGIISKVFFSNREFIIAGIKQSNHKEHKVFTFKGFSKIKPKVGDTVSILRGNFSNSDYGVQLEKGSLIINEARKSKIELINDEVILDKEVLKNTKERRFKLTEEQQECIIAAQEKRD